jgi:FixJ family two-component response regulator
MSSETVFLVDDDPSFLLAQSRMLRVAGIPVCTFHSAKLLLDCLAPDDRGCIVTDLFMPGMSGLELQAALAQAGVVLPIVFLTGRADIPSTVHAMRDGAVDFLEKSAPCEVLLEVIRRALASDTAAHESRQYAAELRRRFSRLSPRETEVLRCVLGGRLNKQIAAQLGIHERTVKLHRTSITMKLGVRSAAQIGEMAHEAGIDVSLRAMPAVRRGGDAAGDAAHTQR